MTQRRIAGVCLVKNEDKFIGWALSNIAAFCDEILVMDNQSNDGTRGIIAALAEQHRHIRVISVEDANKTHAHVEQWIGTDTWVFGVDGDEIYDREGLLRLRPRLLAGAFDGYWRIYGHALHTRTVDLDLGVAAGYVQPNARSITKLYNFAGISAWHQPNHERLHGKDMVFRPGYHWDHAYNFWEHETWERSECRCLHMCFQQRSSQGLALDARDNPIDVKKSRRLVKRMTGRLLRWLDKDYAVKKNYKYKHYALGPVATLAINGFGRPTALGAISPDAVALEAVLADARSLPEAIR